MKRIDWPGGLAAAGIVMVFFCLYNVLSGNLRPAAIDAGLVAIFALILLAIAASR